MKRKESTDEVKRSMPVVPTEQMEAALRRVSRRLQMNGVADDSGIKTAPEPVVEFEFPPAFRLPSMPVIAAVAALLILAIWIGTGWQAKGVYAVLRSADGALYRLRDGESVPIRPGERITPGEAVRAASGSILALEDGSTIELRSQSELRLERAVDGVRMRLNNGSILVSAAKQREGHLYVQTPDVTVSVVGTVFLVETDQAGSRVAVIEGEVHVRHGQEAKTLLPGEQVATTPAATLPPMREEISWSKNFAGHLALLQRSVAVPTIPTLAATTGTIRGVVRHALTGQPIPEAQVQLTPAAGVNLMPAVETFFSTLAPGTQLTPALLDELSAVQSAGGRPAMLAGPPRGLRMNGPSGPGLTRGTLSGFDGRFAFNDVAPGKYTITVRREGYAGPASPGINGRVEVSTSPILVVENRATPDVAISLVRDGVFSGRILDADGNPMGNVSVAAFQLKYDARGRATYVPVISKTSDQSGAYRLFGLAPGEYWVGTTPTSNPDSGESNLKTFYPGTTNPHAAAKFTLREGEELAGLEFVLKATTRVKVSGRVTKLLQSSGEPAPVVPNIALVPLDPDNLWDTDIPKFKNLATDRTNGQFELRGIPSGAYDLIATAQDNAGGLLTARRRIDVGGRDLTGVTLTLKPGVEVRARINYVGGIPNRNAVWLRIRSLETYAKPFDDAVIPSVTTETTATRFAIADATGTYVFRNVPESKYTFQLAGLPDNAIIDIRDAGRSVFDEGLSIGTVSSGLIEVIVNLGNEAVGGIAYGVDQKPVPGARVVLAPQQGRRHNSVLYQTITTDASGRFTFTGVIPGEYKVFAWQVPPPRNAYLNAEFLSRYENGGRAVQVTSGGRPDLQIPAIPEGR
jgi:protocatechuate 3,4-dioxygenase beta subunit